MLEAISLYWRKDKVFLAQFAQELHHPLVAADDILKVSLQIDRISQSVILLCIDMIQSGYIYGRQAIYCVAEIRLYIVSLRSRAFNGNKQSGTTEICASPINFIDNIIEIANACIYPVINANIDDMSNIVLCFDLIPICIIAASTIGNMNRPNSLNELHDNNTISILIDSILISAKWNNNTLLALSNLVCEIYSFLTSLQVDEFKVYFVYI